jgi:DnaJ-domain-containing protein 1
MQIDQHRVCIEQTKDTTWLLMLGPIMGVKARITLEELEALIAELSREATTWRRRIIPDLYSILEITRTATADEIRAAYRRLMKAHHPDTGTGGNTERTQQINQAYAVLGDPEGRQAYDALNLERSAA